MNILITSGYSFAPGTPGTIDFTNTPSVTKATLLAVYNLDGSAPLYLFAEPGLGGQWQGRKLVLEASCAGQSSTDQLNIFVDDGRVASGDDTLRTFATTQHADELAGLAVLDVLATENTLKGIADDVLNLTSANHQDLAKLDTDLAAAAAQAHADAGAVEQHVDSFATQNHGDLAGISGKVALDASLQQILQALQQQRQETIWTDDTRAYFIRIDNKGTISWTDVTGNASAGPGVGGRPAAGDDALLDKSSYQAIAAGTGYAIGDLIDHVLTTDPKSGAIVGHFWLNLVQESVIAAPASSDVEALSRLPDDAARASLQTSIGTTAHADSGKLDTDLVSFATTNHADLATLTGKVATAAQLPASLGAKVAAQSLGVTLATDGQFVASVGLPGDGPAPDDTSSASIVSLLRRGLARWTTLLGRLPAALGQAASAASMPVVIASDQSVLGIAGTAAAGTAPVNPPLSVSGVDGGGLKRHVLLDTLGRILLAAMPSRVTATGPLGAANASVSLAVDGMQTAILKLSGSWVGTVTFLGSMDGGTTYDVPVNMILYGGGTAAAPVGSATANGAWEMACSGLTHLQAVMSAYTSGSAMVLLGASYGLKSVRVGNPSGNPLTVATTSSAPTTDASGTLAAAGAATPIASNATRQLLILSNTGGNPLTYRFGAVATATVGHVLGAGMTVVLDDKCPSGQLNLFSTSGTTFFVTTG